MASAAVRVRYALLPLPSVCSETSLSSIQATIADAETTEIDAAAARQVQVLMCMLESTTRAMTNHAIE